MKKNEYDIAVVGAGASGMMAAGRAAELGAGVVLIDGCDRPGRKLLITGKGRSNVTNSGDLKDFIGAFGKNGRFLYRAFSVFFRDELMGFFRARGVALKLERGGRYFPESDRSSEVVDALVSYTAGNGAKLVLKSKVKKLLVSGGGSGRKVEGVLVETGERIPAKRVIVATGGLSYPLTGSTGDGYGFARELGHTVTCLRPALVPLETEESFVRELQGLALKNVEAELLCEGKTVGTEFGEMLFTHFGVSGPIILTLSGKAVELTERGKNPCVSVNLKPALSKEQLHARLQREFDSFGLKSYQNILKTLLPKSLIPVFVKLSGIPADKKGNQITKSDREKIYGLLTGFKLNVKRARPIEEAIVTAGGVSLKEVDPYTMESRLIKGLYFCGEVLDIDGVTGGYNLQAAFSTGYLAGESAAGGAISNFETTIPKK
ncbi:MAG: NAD(P)/FAD-dependent oxidoreductase [Endomicrobiales bacterium]|nr:NAD(P)/FAD-dependent oxidoreductase [Endomicrobiales bacterium]